MALRLAKDSAMGVSAESTDRISDPRYADGVARHALGLCSSARQRQSADDHAGFRTKSAAGQHPARTADLR